jgi:hypothetical protein
MRSLLVGDFTETEVLEAKRGDCEVFAANRVGNLGYTDGAFECGLEDCTDVLLLMQKLNDSGVIFDVVHFRCMNSRPAPDTANDLVDFLSAVAQNYIIPLTLPKLLRSAGRLSTSAYFVYWQYLSRNAWASRVQSDILCGCESAKPLCPGLTFVGVKAGGPPMRDVHSRLMRGNVPSGIIL